jgi:RNA polymerase sigma-70 factor (ECF subfamily)
MRWQQARFIHKNAGQITEKNRRLMTELSWTTDGPSGSPGFEPGFHTDWFMVRAAGAPSPQSADALEQICRTYWFPLYAYVRHKGYSPHDAQDLTQGFFAHLLERPWLRDVHPAKGRFRCFLLASLNHFLANEWRREQAEKRGGSHAIFSLDALEAEDRYRIEPAHDQSPDRIFDRGWARTLLQQVMSQLRAECADEGREDLFRELEGRFNGEKNPPGYAEIAARLGMSAGAVKKAAQRLRERYQELLRAEVAATVSDPAEVDAELRALCTALQT